MEYPEIRHGYGRRRSDELSVDDRLLIRAVALVGDVIHEGEMEQLLQRWPWGRPMTWERVRLLEARGLLARTADGWFVKAEVDAVVSEGLGVAVQALLTPFVGMVICHEAETLERFRLGLHRALVSDDRGRIVEVCRAWANTPAGIAGPRGLAFLKAVGLERSWLPMRLRILAVVPEVGDDSSLLSSARRFMMAMRQRPDSAGAPLDEERRSLRGPGSDGVAQSVRLTGD